MTDAGDRSPDDGVIDERDVERQLGRALRRARFNLWWERLWPRLAPLAALAGLYAAVSWLGLWRLTADPVRYALLAAFAAVAAWLLWRLARMPRPDADAALARVEAASGKPHRPATAFADRIATRPDGDGLALWAAHRRRLLAELQNLRAGLPSPRLAARDPYALRFAVALLAAVGFVVAGPERLTRLTEAFQGAPPPPEAVARIDAWVTPPAYTGRPPIFLTGATARPDRTLYAVPAGSVVTVRTGDAGDFDVVRRDDDGETPVAPAERRIAAADAAAPPLEHVVELGTDTAVAVRRSGRDVLAWRFAVEGDRPPTIAYVRPPEVRNRSLALAYALADDYGVVAAEADLAPLVRRDGHIPRPLYEAPALPLSLPQLRTREGEAETARDFAAHPWAGAEVAVTLQARDEAGQQGRSATETVRLPARRFGNALARAVAEQRSNLALDAEARTFVADSLDALTIADDIERAGDYLALRSAYYRLVNARDDDGLREVVDYLWEIALGIEEGDLSPTMRDLNAAREALREALENGADEETIARLTEELREAMRAFMEALAEDALRMPPRVADLPPDAQTVSPMDLERMLDRIEELSRSGANDAARDLLDRLQSMLENLQAGQPMFGQQDRNGEMMEGLNELGDMIRQQEELLNRTFRADRGQNPDGPPGQPMTEQETGEALRGLQQGQEGLAEALRDLMERLEQGGLGDQPGELGEAGRAMDDAAGALGEGAPGQALGSQGQALESLRQGAETMMDRVLGQQPGQGQGPGDSLVGGRRQPNADPLGRPREVTGPDLGDTVTVPDEIDAQRAREILDAIRRKLGEIGRPQLERDYLERLLERF